MNGLKKECMNNLLEIWIIGTRVTHGYEWRKVIWKDGPSLWYVVLKDNLYKPTISSAILTNLGCHPFVWYVVQEMILYLV